MTAVRYATVVVLPAFSTPRVQGVATLIALGAALLLGDRALAGRKWP